KFRKKQPVESQKTVAWADTILTNVFTILKVKGKIPFCKDGHRDWYYKGPNNDAEWAWLSNRHPQLDTLYSVYFRTGNSKYVDYTDEFLRDFIIKSWPYPAKRGSNSIWRGLEVSFRAKVWTKIFYGFINNPRFNEATKLLILSSLPDHAHYNRNFHSQGNWLTMEISGLATIAAYFPEYKLSGEWMNYAIKTMTASMKEQVYPDGVQNELTSHYHRVALENFMEFKNICEDAGFKLPAFYYETIEKMAGYIADTMRPNGFGILNNDGDKTDNRELISDYADVFHHPEWKYIAFNGNQGIKPRYPLSCFYPWAGQLISRSGYGKDSQWSFFDVGPWGKGHQHNDKLHISIAAYGRDLLVDAGRFAYTGEVAQKFRGYALSSFAHNTVIIDNKSQGGYKKVADKPQDSTCFKITPEYDYASGSMVIYKDLEGMAKHSRSLMYVRNVFWIVVDHINTDRPREIDILWHWYPDCVVEKQGNIVKTTNKRGNLTIIPLTNQNFDIELVKGQENPIQGWYSPEYNLYKPNITSSFHTKIKGNTTMVWLLVPSEKGIEKLKYKVIAITDKAVRLMVKYNNRESIFTVPFTEAALVEYSVK
ncbi:MAG: alginate lyase family protein, partial [Bacteroidaceae bacterium]